MMHISDYDVETSLQFAVRHTANRLGIADPDWKTIHELREEIVMCDPDIGRLLSDYIDAYLRWYRWHKAIDSAGKQGALNDKEKQELFDLVKDRDRTRSAVADRVRSLP